MHDKKYNIVILGPTASGKTKLAIDIAKYFNIPIINVDSRQFWQDVKILTASPSQEELQSAEHLMFNYLPGNIKPSLGLWVDHLKKIQYPLKIIVGGNGFYINSLLKGIVEYPQSNIHKQYTWDDLYKLNPNTKVHKNDIYKIQRHAFILDQYHTTFEEYQHKYTEKCLIIAIIPDKNTIYQRIVNRAPQLIQQSIEEIKNIHHHDNYNNIIGYIDIKSYLNHEITYSELEKNIILKTYQYAKKQLKFLNIIPIDIKIHDHNLTNNIIDKIKEFIISI